MKYRGKPDTTWNIPRNITLPLLHFMLYCGKSIIFGTVYLQPTFVSACWALSASTQRWQSEARKKCSLALYLSSEDSSAAAATYITEPKFVWGFLGYFCSFEGGFVFLCGFLRVFLSAPRPICALQYYCTVGWSVEFFFLSVRTGQVTKSQVWF